MKNLETIICPSDPTATLQRVDDYHKIYQLKYDICKAKNPKRIAEIGVRAGYSAWTFLQACPNATYYGFDANNGTHGGAGGEDGSYWKWAESILSGYGDAITLSEIDTQKVDHLILSDIDLFHVDGDHTVQGVMHDLDLAVQAINDDGWILVDDIVYLEDVAKGATKWLFNNRDKFDSHFIMSLRGDIIIWRKGHAGPS